MIFDGVEMQENVETFYVHGGLDLFYLVCLGVKIPHPWLACEDEEVYLKNSFSRVFFYIYIKYGA